MDKSGQFWREEPMEFHGSSGTKYVWPADRAIIFAGDDGGDVMVPTFDLRRVGGLDANLEAAIKASMEPGKGLHFHLVLIEGYPHRVAIVVYHHKMEPQRDFQAWAHARDEKKLAAWMAGIGSSGRSPLPG